MLAYEFSGYWKDVGTIDSLYEANMDLLGDKPNLDVSEPSWKIQSRSPLAPPHFIGEGVKTVNSIIMSGCEIHGDVENSVLSSGVIVKKGASVKNSIIMSNAVINENAQIEYSIIDEDTTIGKNAIIGEEKANKMGITVLGRKITIADNCVVKGGSIIDFKDFIFLFLLVQSQFLPEMFFYVKMPYACTMDFRYIVPNLLIGLIFIAENYKESYKPIICASVIFCILSLIFELSDLSLLIIL